MALKVNARFKVKLTCGLKHNIRNLLIFMRAVNSLKICTLMGSFCPIDTKS